MSCSVPVISSDIGGIPELNIHGETGFLCSLGDVDSMGDYAIKLLSDEKLRKKMSENARARALKFETQNIINQYEAYYIKIKEMVEKKSLERISQSF